MVFLGGIVHEVAEQEADGDGRQRGVVQAAGSQLHPGHGPEASSVSGQLIEQLLAGIEAEI